MPSLTARDVADYFLASVDEEAGDNISNLKLQKLVYYTQGFHLAMYGRPLFDDPVVAWQHGPVVPSLYRAFRDYRAGAIPPPEQFDASKYPAEVREVLDEVQQVYGQFSALRLREMTHAENPWRDTPLNETIGLDLMRDYFGTLVVSDGQG